MTADTRDRCDHRFLTGVLMGAFMGAAAAIWLAPRVAAFGRAVDDFTKKGQRVRDDVADAVARGAHEVERIATAAKSDGVAETRQHAAAAGRSDPHSL